MPAPLRGDARDLPQLQGYDKAALDAYRAASKQHEATEELRLGYVAFTRAEHEMWVTSFLWNARKTPFGPSPFQETMRDVIEGWGEEVAGWLDKPAQGRHPSLRRRRPVAAVAARPASAARPSCASPRPRPSAPSSSAAPDEGLDVADGRPGRRLGRRHRAAAGRGPGRPRRPDPASSCRPACRRRR